MSKPKKRRGGFLPLDVSTVTKEEWERRQESPPAPPVHFVRSDSRQGIGE